MPAAHGKLAGMAPRAQSPSGGATPRTSRGASGTAAAPAQAPVRPAPVTLVVGEEEYLADRTVRELIAGARALLAEAAVAGEGDGDAHEVDGGQLTPGELA